MTGRPRLALGTRNVVLTALLLSVVVLLCLVVTIVELRRDLTDQVEQRALAIALSVAEEPELPRLVSTTKPSATGPIEREAEAVRRRTGALYVVVADVHGIRYSHPTADEVGKRVSTSPQEALAGHDVVAIERGTLGRSARGKVPMRDSSGTIVGVVSVGIDMRVVDREVNRLTVVTILIGLIPLTIGLLGAITLGRRLRRTTLGLQPDQMADLVREHEAVLHGVRDGVLAVDPVGRVTVTNPQAVLLIGSTPVRGQLLSQAGTDPTIEELMTMQPAPQGALRILGDRAVLATRLPVRREGRDLGQVLILRDHSDLDELARELEATRALTDAVRAQAHEHTNRLHTLTGLLHGGHLDEALSYLDELSLSTTWINGLADPYLAGLVAAKSAVASESGVLLQVTAETNVEGALRRPLDMVTVIANLIDNAIRAAASGQRSPAYVDVTLLSDGEDLLAHVQDSGDGVPPSMVGSVFDHGFTGRTEGAEGHGLGLALARHTARATGGDIVLASPGGPPPAPSGAVFEARLCGVVGVAARAGGLS